MSILSRQELVKVFANVLKISYAREKSVRDFANAKWRNQVVTKSKGVIFSKIKLLLSKCRPKTVQVLSDRGALNECSHILRFVISCLGKKKLQKLELYVNLLEKYLQLTGMYALKF